MVSAVKDLLNQKHFLLTAVGVFAVFTLFTAPLFSMISFTRRGGEGFIQQVVDDNPYHLLRQASASEAGEEVVTEEGEEPTGEVVIDEPPPTEEPPTEPSTEPPPDECPPGTHKSPGTVGLCVPDEPQPPEPDVQQVVPEEGEVPEPLTASFSIDSTNGDTAPNATFLFEADAQGGTPPYTYIWNFGDESPQGSGISIHHTFQQAGTYDVTLAVTDSTAPTPQDISVTRQVNVRPATTTTDEIALPSTNVTTQPTLPMNQTTLMNQTNQTTLLSMTGPSGLPPCIMISDRQYCLLPPNTPKPTGEECVSLRLIDGTEVYYCLRSATIGRPLPTAPKLPCLSFFGSEFGPGCKREQPSGPTAPTNLTAGRPAEYYVTLKSIQCGRTEDAFTDETFVIVATGYEKDFKQWGPYDMSSGDTKDIGISTRFDPNGGANIQVWDADRGDWIDRHDNLGAKILSDLVGVGEAVFTGDGAWYRVTYEVVRQ
jgi:PKD repeat protein